MTTAEERMQILKMIQEGKISAEEGAKLLQALGAGFKADKRPPVPPTPGGSDARWFRVRVTDLSSGKNKVNVNIPMGLVNVAMKMGARFAPNVENVDGSTQERGQRQAGRRDGRRRRRARGDLRRITKNQAPR